MGSFVKHLLAFCLVFSFSNSAFAFDHSHKAWNDILSKNVVLKNGGQSSAIRYKSVDKAKLKSYVDTSLAVSKASFKGWNKNQQLAFYFNLYNALTVQLILTKYPIKSIQNIGSKLPWKETTWEIEYFKLFGVKSNLDSIEHRRVRESGLYKEPRVHFAFNCASIGCPALRNEAFVATKLDAQLEQAMVLFLKDKSRNKFKSGALYVSKIFYWYRKDFEKGWKGYKTLEGFFAKHAQHLSSNPAEQALIKGEKVKINFETYNWNLNDAG